MQVEDDDYDETSKRSYLQEDDRRQPPAIALW
jgi:hypothetical protein